MRLRAGAQYYEHRNHSEDPGPFWVKRKGTGQIGYVTRATPAGNHIPPQAFVMFGNDKDGYSGEWVPTGTLERAF
jgi:hypothetical protein